MRISVVIPVFNRPGPVRRAIESVCLQSFAPEEIIVVDDGSDDATPEVLREFGKIIRIIRQSNSGVAAARNRGGACGKKCMDRLFGFG